MDYGAPNHSSSVNFLGTMASRSITFAAFLCFPLFFLTPLPPCHAKDTLKAGESVADGETLVSVGNVFELGFFTPGKSTKRYVGIWYYNFSTDTVLWVANRESPVHDNSGRLAIDASGNLAILDGGGRAVWSTNASLSKLSNESAVVQLLDNGNLVLNGSSGPAAWQSFDHPIDTYLPGMKVGLDIATGVNQLFTSWRSEDDPAQGNFSMGIDPRGSTQIFLWEGEKPWWRSGRWNQQVFIGIQNMAAMYIYGFKLSNFAQEGKMYFYYNVFNSSHRYVLRWNGTEEHLMWRSDTKNWARIWAQPITQCEIYNKCGNNARCIDESEPICSCLKGHVPAAAGEWSGGNWTSGCVKRAALQCERNESSSSGGGGDDGFWKMEGVKLPDLSDWESDVLDEDGCRATCLTNCSCRAYAYVSGIGCLVWGVDLVDVHIFSSGGNDMYLKLAASELEGKKKTLGNFAIAIIVLAVVFALACLYLAFKCRKRMTAICTRQRGGGIVSHSLNRDGDLTLGTGSFSIPSEAEDHKRPELPLLSFDSISTTTANFSRANLLGEGGFGPVYKGTLPGGHEIAVKRLSRGSGQGQDEFKNEVVLIAKLQHRNLVRLLGCCIHSEEKLLIYEYMPNKSLDAFLFDPRKKELLDWNTRYNIIEGIARGLLYLHRDSRLRIIHRDLKTSNILLDKDMNPKISDFGMARIFGNDDSETNTKRVVGTYGYMSPEYAMQGAFSVKSDVYSFGVLLLEIVSGRRNSTFTHQESTLNLLGYAWKLWNEDDVEEFVDPAIRDSCSLTQASRCVNVGLLCVQDKANDRPTMSSVVIMLEGGTDSSPQPRQPTFAAERNQSDTDKSTSDPRGVYSNDSITLLTGR